MAQQETTLSAYIDVDSFHKQIKGFHQAVPFRHCVIDNFFLPEIALQLEKEIPDFDSEIWHQYNNAIEIKKVCNNWNVFPPTTYKVFSLLNSSALTSWLSEQLFEGMPLYYDSGLNGGGWHIHKQGGKLNTHLDYSLHPKLKLQRKLNMIVYLNSSWQDEWGGHLGFWGNESSSEPGELIQSLAPRFNRAVLFDTTQNSWHGLPQPLRCPATEYRKSLAVYYLCDPPQEIDPRGKALFAPTEEQKDDPKILELIRKRSNIKTAASVYSKEDDPHTFKAK